MQIWPDGMKMKYMQNYANELALETEQKITQKIMIL
jgi:hypothetical protein